MQKDITQIDINHLETLPTDDFFTLLFNARSISALPQKMLAMLKEMYALQADAPELKILCLYLSLLEDGNICIALDKTILAEKWSEKWQSVQELAREQYDEHTSQTLSVSAAAFDTVISAGIDALKNNPRLAQEVDANLNVQGYQFTTPFVFTTIDGKPWLFAQKYFVAKRTIEEQVARLFPAENEAACTPEEIAACQNEILEATKTASRPVKLNEEQAQAVVRGAKGENLFITGGPGRGKTTVVFFLLQKLFQSGRYDNHKIYIAAPSGKASDRVKESIFDELVKVSPQTQKDKDILDKIKRYSHDPYTIHRLLSFSPMTGSFVFNKDNQFPQESIFVIDEASMID
ncbi:MAG: AAA family ATPase, partial [Treponema sp.]|nr:AAA family ATPase [Treponema sp.]